MTHRSIDSCCDPSSEKWCLGRCGGDGGLKGDLQLWLYSGESLVEFCCNELQAVMRSDLKTV